MRLAVFMVVLVGVGAVAVRAEEADSANGKKYIKDSVSPGAIAGAALGASVSQATDTPGEWGHGAGGFARRFGSSFGKHLVKRGIQYPMAKVFHEELGYRRSDKTGFRPRLLYALSGTVITHKTTTGKATVNKSELVSAFGSGLISRLWQPASTRTIGLGFASGGITLGTDAAANVLREFWPEIRHPHSHNGAQNKSVVEQSPTSLSAGPAVPQPDASK
jgi:hypothetical protein